MDFLKGLLIPCVVTAVKMKKRVNFMPQDTLCSQQDHSLYQRELAGDLVPLIYFFFAEVFRPELSEVWALMGQGWILHFWVLPLTGLAAASKLSPLFCALWGAFCESQSQKESSDNSTPPSILSPAVKTKTKLREQEQSSQQVQTLGGHLRDP